MRGDTYLKINQKNYFLGRFEKIEYAQAERARAEAYFLNQGKLWMN